jgi:hypothetical protein
MTSQSPPIIITRQAHRSHRHGDLPAGSRVRFVSHDADKGAVWITANGRTRVCPEGIILDAGGEYLLAAEG